MNFEEAKTLCMSYAAKEIDGKYYYSDDQVINMLETILKGNMKCPRDNAELEMVDERLDWQHFRCPECKMKITYEEGEDDN